MIKPTWQRQTGHRLLVWQCLSMLLCLFAAAYASAENSAESADTNASRPNILLILTDDQGWGTLGCYGGKTVPTPHLDKLAAGGARFTSAYVTSQCTPTRATLLSGQYTARTGMWHVLRGYGFPWARVAEQPFTEQFPSDAFNLAKGLQASGYVTGIMGKWYVTANEDGNYMGLDPAAAKRYGFDVAAPLLDAKEFEPGGDRGVDTLTDQALAFIEKHRDQPWFCYVSHHMIHGVVVAPNALTEKYEEQGYGNEGPNRAVYLAGLECIDQSVGRLLKKLDELDEAKETLVVFLSDNGGIDERLEFQSLQQPHPRSPELKVNLREYDNAPLRAGKGSLYEGGVRVPMIIRWPGNVDKSVIDTPVHAVDLVATLLAIANADVPKDYPLDGVNLLPLMQGEVAAKEKLAERPIYQYSPFYDLNWGLTPSASIRRGDFKLIEHFGDRFDAENKYVAGHHVELFDLSADIGEQHNLAEAKPELAEKMLTDLHRWMADCGVKPCELNPHYDPDKAFLMKRDKPYRFSTSD